MRSVQWCSVSTGGGGVGGDGCSVVLWWCVQICRAVQKGPPPTKLPYPWGLAMGAKSPRPATAQWKPTRAPPLRAVQNIPPLSRHHPGAGRSRSGSTVPQPPSTSADGRTYTDHGSLPSSSAAPLPRATFEQTVSCHAPLSPLLADPRQTTLSLSRCPSSQRRTSPRRPSSPSFSQSVSQSVSQVRQPAM